MEKSDSHNEKSSGTGRLKQLLQVLLRQNIPFASYRLPGEKEIITLVQHHSMPAKHSALKSRSGFIIAPFNESAQAGSYFLQPDCVFFSSQIENIHIEKLAANNRFINIKRPTANSLCSTEQSTYIDQVNKAKAAMQHREFNKVVLSKIRKETLPDSFRAEVFFEKLQEKSPRAMVYFLQLPEVGCWIGATPEPLLQVSEKKAHTVSLAGTQLASEKGITDYEWSPKEIEEQGIVTDFVEKTLIELGISSYTKQGPENVQAANLIHLKTSFEFSLPHSGERLGEFLQALHPTPSVGGLPKNAAYDFIVQNEQHQRTYYTGFLGPVNIEQRTDIFVNLRCLQLFDNEYVLYSGAGITASSNAEKEWEETDNKMMTMKQVIMTTTPKT